MKILIAPDKFKGSLSAMEVGRAIAKGIHQHDPNIECTLHPLADGGDGSMEVLQAHLELQEIQVEVHNPLGRLIQASYFMSGNTAFVEMAKASGLVLLAKNERNPLKTSTLGTGELIANALAHDAKKIFLFLGGSATNDAGIGIAHALGFRFLNQAGKLLSPIGENLIHIHQIQAPELVSNIQFFCLCDVKNPLLGKNGASYVYAPQKGANPEQVVELERGMRNFAKQIEKQFAKDIRTIEGGGAAGGIAAGLSALLNAEIKSGIATILELTNFEQHIQAADWVISGEGKLDNQTLEGKAINGVSDLAKQYRKPLVLFVGQHELDEKAEKQLGIIQLYSVLANAENSEDAMQDGARILTDLGRQFATKHF